MSEPDKIELTEEILEEWRSLGPGYVKQLIDALRATRQELATIQAAHLMDGAETVARNKRIAELEQQLDAIAKAFLEKAHSGFTYTPQTLALEITERLKRDRERIETLENIIRGLLNPRSEDHWDVVCKDAIATLAKK